MNILLASSKYMPEYSGSGFRAHNLYRRLIVKSPEIELTVLAGSETENVTATYDYDGFKINRIADKSYPVVTNQVLRKFQIARNFYNEYIATQTFLRNLPSRPDLIHIFGQNYVTSSVLNYAVKKRIPVLIELCNEMDDPHHYIPFPFKLWISGKPPGKYSFICISERLKDVCVRNGISGNNIWCRPNPINEELFKPVDKSDKFRIRKSLTKFDENSKLLVYVAKYINRKNHRFLLEVIQHLPEDYKLFISGPLVDNGPNQTEDRALFDDIEKYIASNKLHDRVQAENGFCKDIEQYYQMADVYLFPTKAEGLGTPMLEAVACGVPVVANLMPGITDSWIKDGQNGYLSTLDAGIFAEKIIKAADIPSSQMQKESETIISVAGTNNIDQTYLTLINK